MAERSSHDRTIFLRSFVRDWRTIGSITPSSRYLVAAMLDTLAFGQARHLVEYGPGTGVFTSELLRRMAPEARLLTLDTEEHFVEALRQKFADPRLIAVRGSAARIADHLAGLGWPGADIIISGIPYTVMPHDHREAILRTAAQALTPGGIFNAYQYSPYILPMLRRLYQQVEMHIVVRNLPPACFFVCTNPR